MSKTTYHRLLLAATVVLSASACFGQSEIQIRARHMSGWDLRQREGNCQIRLWVDNRAEVRLRGDRIWVTTSQGAKARDEGSECSQSLPYNSVRNFKIRQVAGRSQVQLAQEPNRMNNYTATIAVEDRQGGGDTYAFEVSWLAEGNVANAPAPFFDEVRACQDMVRQQFNRQNGRGAYIDFDSFADRQNLNQHQNQDQDRNRNNSRARNQAAGQERIQGHGNARSYNESRELTYTCIVDPQRNLVQTSTYQYSAAGTRLNQRNPLK